MTQDKYASKPAERTTTITLTMEEAARFAMFKKNTTHLNKMRTAEMFTKLYQAHSEHPEYSRRDLMMVTGAAYPMVTRYWKKFVIHEIAVLRDFEEAMLNDQI